MKVLKILVVDDEIAIRQVLAHAIRRLGHEVITAKDAEEALTEMAANEVDVTFSDVRMPGMTGIELIEEARRRGHECFFVIMTAFASVSTAIDAMRSGAYDYMMKPLRNEDVEHRIKLIADLIDLRNENHALRNAAMQVSDKVFHSASEAMARVDRIVAKVANTDATLMICGASGSGKGVTAKNIHNASRRANKPFIPVNCAAIPEQLLESELFGHSKGAFTGASTKKIGLFEAASGGTLFLDEIGELPLAMQAKLLHVLEDKQIRPVGSDRFTPVDVRIIAATNRDLPGMIERNEFREDLYFRLNVFSIVLPSLSERREDLLPLFRFFLENERKKLGISQSFEIDAEVEAVLMGYDFPGNIRELENIAERAVILAEDNLIRVEDLPQQLYKRAGVSLPEETNLRDRLKQYEQQIIKETLDSVDGDRRAAAKLLGLGLSSLYRKLEEYS
ncbi:sigma-54-dependent transcriptional regulator [Shewanella sedimentimangrovi]|uniref:Sigma-54-dependent Fis family transcriptional regulator n=1 Tax=Shewanella sedimentimangrovi TaxID=2814293 RepID=A0ABX7R3P9_9GAMM|nr:sigma-54 dependent transcriptional regulator [Shewanella sedimentimangrovi]QSX37723.1 sigma-54-dependent Fis family transcriptional regulator [Shewanella sedimentimangrovi]